MRFCCRFSLTALVLLLTLCGTQTSAQTIHHRCAHGARQGRTDLIPVGMTSGPGISQFAPLSASAGSSDVIVISGRGFGPKTNCKVEFTDVDAGIGVWVQAPTDHVLQWTDSIIRVRVPSLPGSVAGTGPIRVVTDRGDVFESASWLTIRSAFTTVQAANQQYLRPRLAAMDGKGGLSFVPGKGMDDASIKALRRALSTWRCASQLAFNLATSTTTACAQPGDLVSTVGFDSPDCPVSPGEPLEVVVSYGTCSVGATQSWHVSEVDIRLNSAFEWNASTQLPSQVQYDLESALVHALGHAAQLEHVRGVTSVMDPDLLPGVARRQLSPTSDSLAGVLVVSYSSGAPCAPAAMQPIGVGCSIAAPVAQAQISPTAGCMPLTVRMTVASPFPVTTTFWDVDNDGQWDGSGSTIDHTFTKAGTYTVRLRVTNQFGTDESVFERIITVFPPPRASAGSDVIACANEDVRIGGESTAGGTVGPYTIRWSPGHVLSDSTVARPLARLTTTTRFVVTVSDGRGCVATDTMVVAVNAKPILRGASDADVCSGSSIVLRTEVVSGFPPYQIEWSPRIDITDETSLAPTVRPRITRPYFLSVTDARGCVQLDTVLVRVVESRPVDIVAPQGTTACEGATLPLVVNGNYRSIEWSNGQSGPILSVTRTGVYSARAISQSGCTTPWASVAVTITNASDVVVQGPPAICPQKTIELDGGADFVGYEWSTGERSRTIIVTEPGRYWVRVLDVAGCWTRSADWVVKAAEGQPRPTIRVIGNDLEVDEGDRWQWYLDNLPLDGETSRRVTVRKGGLYVVEAFNAEGCSSRSLPVSVDPTSVGNATMSPPPVLVAVEQGHVSVQLNHSEHPYTVRLLSCLGEEKFYVRDVDARERTSIATAALVSGVYIVVVEQRKGVLMSIPVVIVR